ncbi:hypothetical protein [Caballeronia cordobensis]|uniref:hypothetical protein n=1 Tax=Caballeronia cordobensis TaxID=1353886 RepID=UPI0011870836
MCVRRLWRKQHAQSGGALATKARDYARRYFKTVTDGGQEVETTRRKKAGKISEIYGFIPKRKRDLSVAYRMTRVHLPLLIEERARTAAVFQQSCLYRFFEAINKISPRPIVAYPMQFFPPFRRKHRVLRRSNIRQYRTAS